MPMPNPAQQASPQGKGRAGRRRAVRLGIGALVFESVVLWLRARRLAGNVVVRCRAGHLFTTLWIPGASVKSLRLGAWRVQRCPIGRHWTVVTPVREAKLSDDERSEARAHHDIRLP